jgi:hypothetical protein
MKLRLVLQVEEERVRPRAI